MKNQEWEKDESTAFLPATWENRQGAYNWQMVVSTTDDEQSTKLARKQQAPIVKIILDESSLKFQWG